MQAKRFTAGITTALAAVLSLVALAVTGCTAGTNAVSTITSATTAVPISITDAPGDQVIAASLTLNSIVLIDSTGKTASILTAPLTFEATHLDAVQEPLFTPAIPQDTYTSVALTYSNAQVAYVDPTTKKVVQTTATLANTSQTITFTTPIVISNATSSLLIDYLVANSVVISGTTVTVTPAFNIAAEPIPQTPTNGTNGLQCGIKGQVTAIAATNFTITNASGTALVIYVNSSTQYQGLTGLSALTVGALVEVDALTQTNGTLLASRVELEEAPPTGSTTPPVLLIGPVTAITGSPASAFSQLARQQVGPGAANTTPQTDLITINGATKFQVPGRFGNVSAGAVPFTPTFSAATLFAGQVVSVSAASVASNAATALTVSLAPQTIDGAIAAITTTGNYSTYTVTLNSGSWLGSLTGVTTVTVYTNNNLQAINSTAITVGSAVRFNGFLFKNNGALVLLADIQADGPGHSIGPH